MSTGKKAGSTAAQRSTAQHNTAQHSTAQHGAAHKGRNKGREGGWGAEGV